MKPSPLLAILLSSALVFPSCTTTRDGFEAGTRDDQWCFLAGGEHVATLLPFSRAGIAAHDQVRRHSPGIFRIVRTFTNTLGEAVSTDQLSLDVEVMGSPSWLMIPSVSYNGNAWGRGDEPKGFFRDSVPWSFSARRTPVPGATYSENQRCSFALFADKGESARDLSCSLIPSESSVIHRLTWPEQELPLAYTNRDQFGPGSRGGMTLAPGQAFTFSAWVVLSETEDNHAAIRHFLEFAWSLRTDEFPPPRRPEAVWALGLRYARESLWAEEGDYRGFSIGLTRGATGWEQRRQWKYEAGWCGQNISLANSLLFDFLSTGDRTSRDMGVAALDTWADKTLLPCGLMMTHYDYLLDLKGLSDRPVSDFVPDLTKAGVRLDACNLGTAASNFLEAHALAARCGLDKPRYRRVAIGICDFMLKDQETSGRYGKAWDVAGNCIDREGTIGAFLIPPMLKVYQQTGDEAYLQSARRAYDYYLGEFHENGYTSAGALDTYCIDKESAVPLLRSSLALYDITGVPAYLRDAESVSWYLSTWLWHYAAVYPVESDFVRYGWSTFGGTSVSVQHHHLDPYALFWVADWLELAELTGKGHWAEKARAVWNNGCQLISDGHLEIHGQIRPAGSQNEAAFNCRWSGGPGQINDWLVAWPTAFRLETLRKVDWDRLR